MPLDISVYNQLFIQEDEVKALTVIDNNVDTKVLAPMIRLAQDLKLMLFLELLCLWIYRRKLRIVLLMKTKQPFG